MKLTRDKDSIGSYMGSFLTFLMYAITIVFFYSKFMVLKHKTDITILRNVIDSEFTAEDAFTAEDGFFVAAALTAYDSETESIERPEYGELAISSWRWGFKEDIGSVKQEYETHNCSDEELGLADSKNSLTYPLVKSHAKEVVTYKKKFKCINKEDLTI